jgi:hypothetical protein
MTTEFAIMDTSVKYQNARSILEEGLFYNSEMKWCRKLELATKFADAESAIKVAKELLQELPVKVLVIQSENNRIGVGEIKF